MLGGNSMILNLVCLQAIGANPRDATLYSARAQAHIQLENWLEAADDASKAIDIDPNLAKAYFRKGYAAVAVPLPL